MILSVGLLAYVCCVTFLYDIVAYLSIYIIVKLFVFNKSRVKHIDYFVLLIYYMLIHQTMYWFFRVFSWTYGGLKVDPRDVQCSKMLANICFKMFDNNCNC